MLRSVVFAGVLIVFVSLTVAVGRSGPSAAPPAADRRISIDGTRFQPDDLAVPLGTVVIWRNRDPFPHNVTARAGAFQSGDLAADGEWRFRLTTRGTFDYVCTLHPGMKGVIHVR